MLDNGHSTISGRLAGAFRNIGRDRIADQIIDTMKQAGYDTREDDPFQEKMQLSISPRERSLFVNRIQMMWQQMSEIIISSQEDCGQKDAMAARGYFQAFQEVKKP